MNIEITPGSVTVTIAAATAAAKVVHWLFSREMDRLEDDWKAAIEARDKEAAKEVLHVQRELDEVRGAFKAVKETQVKLFEKYDALGREFHDYKVHVAETYVGDAKLEKLIAPLVSRLDSIERDLRRGGVSA